jgi:GNAT-family acetyltransferase (TIGR03103 family)
MTRSQTPARRRHRLEHAPSLDSTGAGVTPRARETWKSDCVVDCGWGRLLFGHTFSGPGAVVEALMEEGAGQRDIAFYLTDPHVVLASAPSDLFLDPSHSYRLRFSDYRPTQDRVPGLIVAPVTTPEEIEEVNRIYQSIGSVPVHDGFLAQCREARTVRHLLARDEETGAIVGTVMGVDHVMAFNDPERGSSLWSLAVDMQSRLPRIGEILVRTLIERFQARGLNHIDLSVLHDNATAIALYEKLGFRRIPVYAIKTRNSINERLYSGPSPDAGYNPYARIIIDEARRRGIHVKADDVAGGFFTLTFGGRSIACRESLSDLTSAVAMSRCDDKAVTRRLLANAGLSVPAQRVAGTPEENAAFLAEHGAVVVKPARGEQGKGVAVDLRTAEEVERAIASAREFSNVVLLEEMAAGDDLRIIVIGNEVVAGAIRRPAEIVGTGLHCVAELIERQSRRRAAATGGESRIPVDGETLRCLAAESVSMETVLEEGRQLRVRRTANLHTGGTIHDVTSELHRGLCTAAVEAARALAMPVVGMDLIVPDVHEAAYHIIEANERPGLANHAPAPTAQRFIDLLFPQTARRSARAKKKSP